ncbi:MAG: PAS domain-containing sensor histidine kinase, partial [Phyllobacterium sp.]
MAGIYPFIDIAVLDEIREHFANGDALVVVSPDLESVIWANGQGAAMLGYASVDDILSAGAVLGIQARRQLMALDGFPAIGHGRTVSLRLAFGPASRIQTFQASDLSLPRGEKAILLTVANSDRDTSQTQIAALAIKGFGDRTTHAAILDGTGAVIGASQRFGDLGFTDKTLGDLVREVRLERNRLVKRPAATVRGLAPAGIARLTDSPALHLLFVIEPENAEPEERSARPLPASTPGGRTAIAPDIPSLANIPERGRVQVLEQGATPASAATPADVDKPLTEPFRYRPTDVPARFVWRVVAQANFSEISPELAAAVGPESAAVLGKSFREIALSHGFDNAE